MKVPLVGRVTAPADVLVRELEGEAVLLNVSSGQYFGLDEMGQEFWSALTASESIQVACETLAKQFDVDTERLHRDIESFLEELTKHGLVEILEI